MLPLSEGGALLPLSGGGDVVAMLLAEPLASSPPVLASPWMAFPAMWAVA